MAFDREKRGLFQRKLEKPQVKKHTPLKSEGTTGSFSIRNVAGGVFLFFKGIGEWFKLFNSRNHMIPDADNVYDIGSEDKRWRKIWTGTRSLHIGDVTIGATGTGTDASLTFKAKGSTDETVVGATTIKASTIETPDEVNNIVITAEQNITLRPDNNANDTSSPPTASNVYIQEYDGSSAYVTKLTLRDDGTVNWAGTSNLQVANSNIVEIASTGLKMASGKTISTDGALLHLSGADSVTIGIDDNSSDTDAEFKIITNFSTTPQTLVKVDETGTMTLLGDLVLDDGGHIKEAGGTAAITINGDGHITKIGQDVPSDGEVLTWDGGTSRVAWSAISSTVAFTTTGRLTVDRPSVANSAMNTDGMQLHVDAMTNQDNATSGSGTNAAFYFNKIEGSTLSAGNSSVTTTTAATLFIDGAVTTGTNQTITNSYALLVDGETLIDRDTSGDGAENATGLHVDFDRAVATSGTAAHNDIGIDLDVNSASEGTSTVKGMDIDVVGATSGTHTATGIDMTVSGADTNIGLNLRTVGTHLKLLYDADNYTTFAVGSDGDLTIATIDNGMATVGNITLDADGAVILDPTNGITKFYKAGDTDDLCTLTVAANGATTIATADSDGVAGHLTLDIDGDITLDADGGDITFSDAGTDVVAFDLANKRHLLKYDSGNFFRTTVAADGATTLETVDSDGEAGHLTFDADGSIILDAADGNFVAKNNGTEFSAANSSYAGMILGYTDIGLNEAHATYDLTASYESPTDEFCVTFIVPPSENVLIEVQIQHHFGSSGVGDLYAGLSTTNKTSGYTQVADYHEFVVNDAQGRNALDTIHLSWTLAAATLPLIGSSETIWVAFKVASTTGTPKLQWGGNSGDRYPNFIMKATALPATIST